MAFEFLMVVLKKILDFWTTPQWGMVSGQSEVQKDYRPKRLSWRWKQQARKNSDIHTPIYKTSCPTTIESSSILLPKYTVCLLHDVILRTSSRHSFLIKVRSWHKLFEKVNISNTFIFRPKYLSNLCLDHRNAMSMRWRRLNFSMYTFTTCTDKNNEK